MGSRDDIGRRGEGIFGVRITDCCGRKEPYFRPRFLGEKAETLDFLVELIDTGPTTPYFFVQVRTTRRGYTRRGGSPRLKVGVSTKELSRLTGYPGPVYLVGIDEVQEIGYLLAVMPGLMTSFSSFPTTYPLDCSTLGLLYDEVRQYWAGRDMAIKVSAFTP